MSIKSMYSDYHSKVNASLVMKYDEKFEGIVFPDKA
jgi:hypothetical protein